jgi:TRAP-type uncharacterized transport system fused permease subunit
MEVGWLGMKFAIAGFLVPFMFVYGPAMVLEGTPLEITLVIITGLLGTLALAAAVQGWFLKRAGWGERALLLVAALTLIKPGWWTDLIGLGLLIIVAGYQYIKNKKK